MRLGTSGHRAGGGTTWTPFLVLCLSALATWAPYADAASIEARQKSSIGNGVDLRVLPLGDSITYGGGGPFCPVGQDPVKCNGYRKSLYHGLSGRGNKVEFVGSISAGDFAQNQFEGHRGSSIKEIAFMSKMGIAAAPNVVLLHAGTNDCVRNNAESAQAHSHLRDLISDVYDASPDALVLLCTIIPADPSRSQYEGAAGRIPEFNRKIPDIVSYFKSRGKKIRLVDMNGAFTVGNIGDGLHPSLKGYEIMAETFLKAIEAAGDEISKPTKGTPTSPHNCRATPSWLKKGTIAQGPRVAYSDGDFKPAWVNKGKVMKGDCKQGWIVHFADLDGDGRDDFLCTEPSTGKTWGYLNKGDGEWEYQNIIATGETVPGGKGVMFGDLNGDGRDDYIYVNSDKNEFEGWINQGKVGDNWSWKKLGRIGNAQGAKREDFIMVDLDGDRRDDLCIVDRKTGHVTAWLNTGSGDRPDYHKIGTIANGASVGEKDVVHMGDLTGKGRADFIIVGDKGKAKALISRRQESDHKPRWLPVFDLAQGPDGTERDDVRFADLTGNGKLDYVTLGKKNDNAVYLWENRGSGGKHQVGDGVILCDLDGDGVMDYFWIDQDGRGFGHLNKGKGSDNWQPLGQIARGGNYPQHLVRTGVMTTSGRADYIVLDEETGRADWLRNLGSKGGWGWGPKKQIATGPRDTVQNKFGYKFRIEGVRFADLNGDGLDDYLYVADNGATIMWENRGTDPPDWHAPRLVAAGPQVGVLGSEVQFADTNGDGLVDFVVVSRISGRVRTWINKGRGDNGAIRWATPINFADGPGNTGYSARIAQMTNDNRADYVSINPDNGKIDLWENRCWKVGFPDDPDSEDPDKLPVEEGPCPLDPSDSDTWVKSGAAAELDKFIVKTGSKVDGQYYLLEDWPRKAENHFLGRGNSGLDCKQLSGGNLCPLPDSILCGQDDYPAEWWYARTMIANVHAHFKYAYDRLTDETLINLAKFDTIAEDFKASPPNSGQMATILSNIGAGAGLAGGLAGGPAGSALGVIGSVISWTGASAPKESDPEDLDAAVKQAKAFIGEFLKSAIDDLRKTLKAFNGDGDRKLVEKHFQALKSGWKDSEWESLPVLALDGGKWSSLSNSAVRDAIDKGMESITGTVLGHLLSSLKYMIATPGKKTEYDKEICKGKRGIKIINDQCYYFLRRRDKQTSAEIVSDDDIEKMEKKYGIDFDDFMKNSVQCDNKIKKREPGAITSTDTPSCFYGIYVLKGLHWPTARPENGKEIPKGLADKYDSWDDWNIELCKRDRKHEYCWENLGDLPPIEHKPEDDD